MAKNNSEVKKSSKNKLKKSKKKKKLKESRSFLGAFQIDFLGKKEKILLKSAPILHKITKFGHSRVVRLTGVFLLGGLAFCYYYSNYGAGVKKGEEYSTKTIDSELTSEVEAAKADGDLNAVTSSSYEIKTEIKKLNIVSERRVTVVSSSGTEGRKPVPVRKVVVRKASCPIKNHHPSKSKTRGHHTDEDCCLDPDESKNPRCAY